MSVMKTIFTAIQIECDRQQVGIDRVMMLADVYMDAMWAAQSGWVPLSSDLLGREGIAYRIEPKNRGSYRFTPVFFDDLSMGLAPGLIERAMDTWERGLVAEWQESLGRIEKAEVDRLIRDFLVIHPFQDGNGRIAWLLRVWLLNQWTDPEPLPDYFPNDVSKQTI